MSDGWYTGLMTAVNVAAIAINIIGPKQCFAEGTLVETEEGLKPIEKVKVGDKVLAYDEATGKQSYKEVVQLFRNESLEWTGITVGRLEIVSTPGHKYFLPETKAWVSATELKVGTKVLHSDGTYGIIEAVRDIHYDTPQTTYNFEVEDFHTYYVGAGVLVHNEGCGQKAKQAVDDEGNGNRWLDPKFWRGRYLMYIIKIPSNVNKLDFANKLLNKLLNEFNGYEFINCTESPLNEYAYFEYKGMYYRKIMRQNSIVVINEANYVDSYEKENLMSQGISLQEYIEMNMLFELEKILVVSKFDEQIDSLLPLITISICPDGLNEVHFSGQETLLNNMIMLLSL